MEEQFRQTVAKNISICRKRTGMTQMELADKLNYSDKSVSKWERGESLPDIYVLKQMAEIFQVRVDDLLHENPPEPGRLPSRILVAAMSCGLVWLVAAFLYLMIRLWAPSVSRPGLVFVFAIPVALIVLTVFMVLWWGALQQCVSISLLVWTMALSVFFLTRREGISGVFILAGILQTLVILWFLFISRKKKMNL